MPLSTNAENELLENVNRNLEVIIGLLLRNLPDADAANSRGRILMLSEMGVRPRDIARLLGKTENHVNVTLSQSRSAKKKKNKRSRE